MKLVKILTLLIFVVPNMLGQDTLVTNQKIYYFDEDSLSFDFFEFRTNRSCLTEYYSNNFIADKVGEPISGWAIVQKRRYLIARQMLNGFQNGFEIQYKKSKGNLILNAISIYENDKVSVSFGFDPKIIEKEESLFKSIKAYMVWHLKDDFTEHFSTVIWYKGKGKQKEIRYYFQPEYHSIRKSKMKANRDDEAIECFLKFFKIEQVPKLLVQDNLERSLIELKDLL